MSWQQFCELNGVGARYARASIEGIDIPCDAQGDSYRRKAAAWISSPCSVLLLGAAGRGKTYWMHAVIRGLLEGGTPLGELRLMRSVDLDERLVIDFERFRSTSHLLTTLAELQYLFLDDFGLERDTAKLEKDLYSLLDKRVSHERITVISSNLSEADLHRQYGERICSRLRESHVLVFEGPDLRGARRL